MKTSISIPDDLWNAVVRPGESPSHAVQEALRALADLRAQAPKRLDQNQTAFAHLAAGKLDPDDEDVMDLLDRLGEQALELRALGYAVAVDAARNVSWSVLERIASGSELHDKLAVWNQGKTPDLPEDLIQALWQSIADFDEPEALDESGAPQPGPTICTGIADGLGDVCDAVRQRIASPTAPATPGESRNESES